MTFVCCGGQNETWYSSFLNKMICICSPELCFMRSYHFAKSTLSGQAMPSIEFQVCCTESTKKKNFLIKKRSDRSENKALSLPQTKKMCWLLLWKLWARFALRKLSLHFVKVTWIINLNINFTSHAFDLSSLLTQWRLNWRVRLLDSKFMQMYLETRFILFRLKVVQTKSLKAFHCTFCRLVSSTYMFRALLA